MPHQEPKGSTTGWGLWAPIFRASSFKGLDFLLFLFPFVIGVFSVSFIFRWEWKYLPLKWGGWLVILLTTSSLVGLWLKPLMIYQQDLLVGGFIGEIFSRNLVRYFNRPGATHPLIAHFDHRFCLGNRGLLYFAHPAAGGRGETVCGKDWNGEDGSKGAGKKGQKTD